MGASEVSKESRNKLVLLRPPLWEEGRSSELPYGKLELKARRKTYMVVIATWF